MNQSDQLLLERIRNDRELVVSSSLAREVAAIPNLLHLEIGHAVFQDARAFSEIAAIRSLVGLELRWFEVGGSQTLTNDALKGLRQLRSLSKLRLIRAHDVDDKGTAFVAAVSSLRELEIEDTKMTDEGVQHLARLHDLELLSLEFTRNLKGSGLAALRSLGSLVWLSLQYCENVEDIAITMIEKMPELETVLLNGCEKLSWDAIQKLRSLPKLRDTALAIKFGREPGSGLPGFRDFVMECSSLRGIRSYPVAVSERDQHEIDSFLNART